MSAQDTGTDGLRETGPSRSGTNSAWSVQVRCPGRLPPMIVGDHAFDGEWRDLPMYAGVPGVPSGCRWDVAPVMGLLTYAAAQALRWWFLAEQTVAGKEHRFETRLVRHEVCYDIKTKPDGAHEVVNHMTVLHADHGDMPAAITRAAGEQQ